MSTQCLGEALGLPPSWRRPAAWATLVLCLPVVTAGWGVGVVASVGLAISTWGANEFSMAVLFLIACACAGLGVAALWSTVLPRAVRRVPTTQLRRWQLVGLRLGALVAVVMLALLLFNEPRWRWGTLAWVLVFAWPLVAARCLTGEVGQWLFIPRDAR